MAENPILVGTTIQPAVIDGTGASSGIQGLTTILGAPSYITISGFVAQAVAPR
ncbi:MAG: hypothetical protein WAJ97_12580 [Terriglobales bacterium]|jgi:hypothetical protein